MVVNSIYFHTEEFLSSLSRNCERKESKGLANSTRVENDDFHFLTGPSTSLLSQLNRLPSEVTSQEVKAAFAGLLEQSQYYYTRE